MICLKLSSVSVTSQKRAGVIFLFRTKNEFPWEFFIGIFLKPTLLAVKRSKIGFMLCSDPIWRYISVAELGSKHTFHHMERKKQGGRFSECLTAIWPSDLNSVFAMNFSHKSGFCLCMLRFFGKIKIPDLVRVLGVHCLRFALKVGSLFLMNSLFFKFVINFWRQFSKKHKMKSYFGDRL